MRRQALQCKYEALQIERRCYRQLVPLMIANFNINNFSPQIPVFHESTYCSSVETGSDNITSGCQFLHRFLSREDFQLMHPIKKLSFNFLESTFGNVDLKDVRFEHTQEHTHDRLESDFWNCNAAPFLKKRTAVQYLYEGRRRWADKLCSIPLSTQHTGSSAAVFIAACGPNYSHQRARVKAFNKLLCSAFCWVRPTEGNAARRRKDATLYSNLLTQSYAYR